MGDSSRFTGPPTLPVPVRPFLTPPQLDSTRHPTPSLLPVETYRAPLPSPYLPLFVHVAGTEIGVREIFPGDGT